jgi:peroxiredoxin
MRTQLALALLLLTGSTSSASAAGAEPGAAAPDFTLKDLDGKPVHLADFKGKVVVLEWFNPECPYVKASHTKGSLVHFAADTTKKGVVWLAINSSAPGKQGNGVDKNKAAVSSLKLANPVLLDEGGTVGKAYGATNTPHMFVIGKDGKLDYKGAIDNSPDGEGASPEGGKLINYVDQAIGDLAAGRPIKTPSTKAYGCGVKYGS